jgi:hypothetical protein
MMRLKCHAILANGKTCGASACTVALRRPVCGRRGHYFGEKPLASMTRDSVYPMGLTDAQILIDFLSGYSVDTLATNYNISVQNVEAKLREAI